MPVRISVAVFLALQVLRGQAIDYERQVHPILAAKCLTCHSQERRSGGYSLATYEDVLNGGRSGGAIQPGKSASSIMMARITGESQPRMPLGGEALSPGEIAVIRTWIDEGARSSPAAAPAKAKWNPPLSLTRPQAPLTRGAGAPIDRFAAAYFEKNGITQPEVVSDARFARRAYLDIWGLPPAPGELKEFVEDRDAAKREKLVRRLLADNTKYAEHWISFWNDLLRNDEGANYYSETASRKSITNWLLEALRTNMPFDVFVKKLLNPTGPGDPDGFLIGVNWRGVVSASQTPALQAAQNTAQIFLGINLKCNSCHDSFISKWKLKDAYGLASYFSAEDKLQLFRCDVAQQQFASAGFLFPELNRPLGSQSLAERRRAASEIFTDPRNGRMPRTLVNRIWERLMGRGFVEDADDMDGEPWSPQLLDWLAADFVESGYDLKRLIAAIVSSQAYQLPAVARTAGAPKQYVFRGPEVRRLTAEQFADAVAAITGDWRVASGSYSREWRMPGSSLTRALGRPIRDQVYSTRDSQATTIQAIELTNGETLTHWLNRGARRMLGKLPAEPRSLIAAAYNGSGKGEPPVPFDIDISHSQKLYLIVQDALSTAPDKALPVWGKAELEGPNGAIFLRSLQPLDGSGLREGPGQYDGVRVKFPSVVVYDIAGKGFTRLRGSVGVETNAILAQGENALCRFYIFDRAPSMDRLTPPKPETPVEPEPVSTTISETVTRVFGYALGREPSAAERRTAEAALVDSAHPGSPSADGLADLLWAVLMKPEFQFIY